ncbi:unnamed protein product [Mytilus coruscus]|uniref:Endonuclease/exonuclease/phosphatase domain-containing protein n=1 Tax=Mytilus coruscus TaxID=42192 RepID=A0A6J8B8X3_MYTCO|nr:unnamed protein product [Mytilus coruscus]
MKMQFIKEAHYTTNIITKYKRIVQKKKHKKSKRHSGCIIIYIKKDIFKGITNLSKASTSSNRIWLKQDKSFFGFEKDLFLCAVYIPPYNSTHLDDDFQNLENEIVKFSVKGEIALIGDFNAREVINIIVDYEQKDFEISESGRKSASENLRIIFDNISKDVCLRKSPIHYKKKKKIIKPWSDSEIRNLKSKINCLGKQLKSKPFDKTLRQNYFITAKDLKKCAIRKKTQFRQNFIKKLLDAKTENPQEFSKLLKEANSYTHKNINTSSNDNLQPKNLMKHFQSQGDWVEPENKTHIEEIENFLSDLDNYKDNDITDKPITTTEVKRVIKSLKVGNDCQPLTLESSVIGSVIFAEDLLIMSESKEGLHESLDKCSSYCDKWQLTVNCKKIKTIWLLVNIIKRCKI